jgi:hypothetical protein
MTGNRLLWAGICASVTARLAFWIVTNRTWEDALITTVHAVNAVEGLGLTHHPGEGRVHGFTSAISVLTPLLGEFLHAGWGIFLLKLSSLLAGIVTIVFACRVVRQLDLDVWPAAFLLAYLCFDQNQIFYGMAGMETQVAVAVLLAGTSFVLAGQGLASGLCFGLGVLTRPDFVIWAVPAWLFLVVRDWRAGLKAAAVGVLVAAPWAAFTSVYYGSPVPNTITAKSQVYTPYLNSLKALNPGLEAWADWVRLRLDLAFPSFLFFFVPFRQHEPTVMPVGDAWFEALSLLVLGLAALGVWRVRRTVAFYPAIAYVGAFAAYRILLIPPWYFAWYMPPFTALVMILVAAGLDQVGRRFRALARVLVVALSLAYAVHIPFTFPLEARIQREIEDGVRMQVGLYLRQAVLPHEKVISESAGYIGYYGRVTLYDYPGLTSPTSVEVLGKAPVMERNIGYLMNELQPEWLVLRPGDAEDMRRRYPAVAMRYRLERRFRNDVDLSHWGIAMTSIDREFYVLKRVR